MGGSKGREGVVYKRGGRNFAELAYGSMDGEQHERKFNKTVRGGMSRGPNGRQLIQNEGATSGVGVRYPATPA